MPHFASKIQYGNRNAHRDVGVNFLQFTFVWTYVNTLDKKS